LSPIKQPARHEIQPHVVLVVEDEILVRGVVAEFLRGAGYTVIEARNAAEAVALFRIGRTIDLVFSDVEMPGPDSMDGVGLARWISQHRPGVDVILTSGKRHDAHAEGAKAFLSKPYRPTEVIVRISAILEDRQRAE
jgi:CheY-like chemotaxis protein